jgi:spore coat protein U-like protein
MKRRLLPILVLFALVLAFAAAPVRATTTCSATLTDLAFGEVAPGGALVNASATLNYRCTYNGGLLGGLYGVYVRMCFSIGTGAQSPGYNPRQMTSTPGDTMAFQLYRNSARTQIWGSVDNASYLPFQQDLSFTILANGETRTGSIPVYGQVPAGQAGLGVGAYSDVFNAAHTKLSYNYNEVLLSLGTYPATCGNASLGSFPFTASANVVPFCRLTMAGDLDFGSTSTLAAPIDKVSAIGMSCTARTAWQLGLGAGQHALGGTRRMLGGGGAAIAYGLYRDNARSQPWGSTLNTDTLIGTGSGSAQSFSVYGRVPAQAPVPSGNYADVVLVTVTY